MTVQGPGEKRLCSECGAGAARRQSLFCVECGAGLPLARRPWWRRRRPLIALGTVMVLLTAMAVWRIPAGVATDPRGPVEDLADALRRGDMETILEMVEIDAHRAEEFSGLAPERPPGLLSAETIEEGWELPGIVLGEPYKVGPDPTEKDALSHAVDGRRPPGVRATTMKFGDLWSVAVRTSQRDSGWIRDWELDSPATTPHLLGSISLPHPALGPLTIGGTTFEPRDDRMALTYNSADALIGVYQVTYEHPMFEPATETVAVRPGGETTLSLEVRELKEEVTDEATEQIRRHIETCVEESTVLRPVGCVIGHDPGHYFPLRGDAVWELERMPELEFEPTASDDDNGRPRAVVTTTVPGEASVTYAYSQEPERTDTVEIVVGGYVESVEDGAPTWRP